MPLGITLGGVERRFYSLRLRLSVFDPACSLRAPMLQYRFRHLTLRCARRHIIQVAMSTYTHRNLPNEKSIRLIQLHAKTRGPDRTLHCSISTHPLDGLPPFQALSYTWGAPVAGGPLFDSFCAESCNGYYLDCDGEKLQIAQNLHDALLQMRSNVSDLPLWVDAVCIHQEDQDERSAQVALMSDIYSKATSVIVWLGKEDESARRALRLQHSLGPVLQRIQEEGRWQILLHFPFDHIDFYRFIDIEPFQHVDWIAYVEFHKRTWFHRTWIVQEVALAQKLVVLCGGTKCDWESMTVVGKFMKDSRWANILLVRSGQNPGVRVNPGERHLSISRLAQHFQSQGSQAEDARLHCNFVCDAENVNESGAYLDWMLHVTRPSSASDPRDKVYGVLGLITSLFGHGRNFIHADYNKSAAEVFTFAAACLLEKLPLASALSLVEDAENRNFQDLPSWVPDLTAQHRALNRTGHGRYWDAGSTIRLSIPGKCRVGGDVLHLGGVKCDTVASVSSPTNNLIQDLRGSEVMDIMQNIAPTYCNGQSRSEAIWRTLVCDCTETQYPAPQDVGTSFRHWLCNQAANAFVLGRRERPDSAKLLVSHDLLRHMAESEGLLTATEIQERVAVLESTMVNDSNFFSQEYLRFDVRAKPFWDAASHFLRRRLFLTKKGLLGLCPPSTQLGDSVWVLPNAKVPFMLRPLADTTGYKLVGEVYLHGCMNGEVGNVIPSETIQDIAIR